MEKKELLQLCCTVQNVIYRNEDNGYTVLAVTNSGVTVTAVGMMSSVSVGDELKLIGNWKVHASYGKQFAFDCYEQSMPSDENGILRYLSSGALNGVGRSTAKRIVAMFGDKSLEVIRNEPEKLCIVRGISKEKALEMSETMKKTLGMRELMLELGGYEISVQEAVKIWKNFGSEAAEKIKEDPYILCSEEVGIGFGKAEKIAAKLNIPADAECRIRAGVIYVLTANAKNKGHTCLPKTSVINITGSFLQLDGNAAENTVEAMIKDSSIIQHEVHGKEFLFLPLMFQSENSAAQRLRVMLETPPKSMTGIEDSLDRFEKSKNIKYAALQKEAIVKAFSEGLLILTGGPGTGKTTTLNAIIELCKQKGLKVMLAAPTGRAAQRMSELTGKTAKTIHRLLEVEWDKNDMPIFKRNERNMLECDVLIIDELSMVDSTLFEGVLRALPLGCRLVMVGDSDQLPSVGAGNVLDELIRSNKIPCVKLTEIFRQSMQSLIVTNAHKIVNGKMPEITKTNNDFFFMQSYGTENVSSKIVELCAERLPKAYGYSPLDDIQVLCPTRKGELGVTSMNAKLQAALNPKTKLTSEVVFENTIFRIGDKVMQIKNNYNLLWQKDDGTSGTGVFNGDIGIITDVDTASRIITVKFDDRSVEYEFEILNNLELAYAVTVHKSQGNEFNAVIVPMYAVPEMLCYRNLLYTAVTRAKKILILVGDTLILERMVHGINKTKRYSSLGSMLNEDV